MLRITVVNAHRRYRLSRRRISAYARRVLRGERRKRGRFTIVFIDDRRCRRLNREFLGHDTVTDVISFPLEEGLNPEGEIYVNLDRARAQATMYGVPFGNEVARLVIHGALHLVGFDDRRRKDARRMLVRQERYVGVLADAGRTKREP